MKSTKVTLFERSVLDTFKFSKCVQGSYLPKQQFDSWYLDKYQVQFGRIYYDCFLEALFNLSEIGLIELGPPDEFLKDSKYNVRLTNKGYSSLG